MTEKKTKNKGGRPPKYRGAVTCALVADVPLPCTIKQIQEHLQIDYSTVYDWMEKYEEFSDAVTRRRAQADDEIEGTMYGRALGYTTTVTEEKLDKEGVSHALTKEMHIPGDVNGAKFWLQNRRRKDWSDRKEVEVTGDFADWVKDAAQAAGLIGEES